MKILIGLFIVTMFLGLLSWLLNIMICPNCGHKLSKRYNSSNGDAYKVCHNKLCHIETITYHPFPF